MEDFHEDNHSRQGCSGSPPPARPGGLLALDRLENFSVMQMESALVLSYFLASSAHREGLILRATVEIKGPEA